VSKRCISSRENINYLAMDEEGNVKAGQTGRLKDRTREHAKNGLTIIATWEADNRVEMLQREKRSISFLRMQAQEEEFECLNIMNGGE
jgi:hypothetical protein